MIISNVNVVDIENSAQSNDYHDTEGQRHKVVNPTEYEEGFESMGREEVSGSNEMSYSAMKKGLSKEHGYNSKKGKVDESMRTTVENERSLITSKNPLIKHSDYGQDVSSVTHTSKQRPRTTDEKTTIGRGGIVSSSNMNDDSHHIEEIEEIKIGEYLGKDMNGDAKIPSNFMTFTNQPNVGSKNHNSAQRTGYSPVKGRES